MSYVQLGHLTWPEAAEIGRDGSAIGLIAAGALEQHGPHLPMIMDSTHVEALARAVAERLPVPVVVPPTLSVGLSEHHLAFPGTVTVTPEVFGGLIEAYLEALERISINRVAIISGHGGNFTFIGELASRFSAAHPEMRVVAYDKLMRFVEVAFTAARKVGIEPPETDVHAGFLETSIALDLFDRDLIKPFADVHGYVAAEPGWLERITADGIDALSENGVLGDPTLSTDEAGRAMFDALADELTAWAAESLGVAT